MVCIISILEGHNWKYPQQIGSFGNSESWFKGKRDSWTEICDGNFGLFADPLKAMDNLVFQKAASPYIYSLRFQTKMFFSTHFMTFYQKL